MRILLLNWRDSAHPAAGGAERYVEEIAARWRDGGHEVTLFAATAGEAPGREIRDGIVIRRAGSRLGVYRQAARFVRSTRGAWDLIVESVNTRPFFAHRHAGAVPTVAIFHQLARDVWFHETPLPVALLGRYALEPRWLSEYRGRVVVAASASTASDLAAVGIQVAGIAPPGTPVPPLHLPARMEPPTLVFVGRLTASKRPDHAIAAWRGVRDRHSGTRLVILGDGPMREPLLRSAPAGVHVLGRVPEDEKWAHLARAQLLLVPSTREGWGIVVMEAAATGTPAVGYRVPGLVDSIRDGETGWLCEPDPTAMAAAAIAALADPARPHVSARAREWAASFTWEHTARAVLDAAAVAEPVR